MVNLIHGFQNPNFVSEIDWAHNQYSKMYYNFKNLEVDVMDAAARHDMSKMQRLNDEGSISGYTEHRTNNCTPLMECIRSLCPVDILSPKRISEEFFISQFKTTTLK